MVKRLRKNTGISLKICLRTGKMTGILRDSNSGNPDIVQKVHIVA